ncbi:MAG: glycoside hydrolase family 3 N-terminal domain-containing protein, partial [Gemmatimonadales bacterium]
MRKSIPLSGCFALLAVLATCGPRPTARPLGLSVPGVAAPLDAEARAWVDETLASLTLREKVGQLIVVWTLGDYVATRSPEFEELSGLVVDEGLGGVVVSVGMPHEFVAKLNALQRLARVPLLVASDFEYGPGTRLGGIYALPYLLPLGGGTMFPPLMAFGAIGDERFAYELGRITGLEGRAVGVHLNFGPVLDVNSNPDNPIINTRSFGEDPELVARLGAAFIRGAHAAGLMTTAKHYPGHGDTHVDSHIDLPQTDATRARLDTLELVPFERAVEVGV